MTPVMCTVRHDPPEGYGDCLRACIASLLNAPSHEVPNFAEGGCDFETQITRLRGWLYDRHVHQGGPSDVFLTHFPNSSSEAEVREHMAARNPNIWYLLFSDNHVVVCINDKIDHDPAWYRTTLTPPMEAWTVLVLVCS